MCDDNHHGRLTWPFLSDLKFAARGLRRAPGFTLLEIAALALSLGVNGVVFSLINGVLLRPLPFPNSDRIVNIWEANMKRNIPRQVVSSANYSDWRVQSTVFAQMGSWQPANFNITSPHNEPERVIGTFCDAGFFRVRYHARAEANLYRSRK